MGVDEDRERGPEGEEGTDRDDLDEETDEEIEEERGAPGLAAYRDRERQDAYEQHPEGLGGADLGGVHEAIEEEP
jgi:hypothetical protein